MGNTPQKTSPSWPRYLFQRQWPRSVRVVRKTIPAHNTMSLGRPHSHHRVTERRLVKSDCCTVEFLAGNVRRFVRGKNKRICELAFSHLPVYSDIVFVEIRLENYLLSPQTRNVFKKEFQKRKQAQTSKINSEKRADERAKRKEQARIDDLKARFKRLSFYQIVALVLRQTS
jgi:hypothetical protein